MKLRTDELTEVITQDYTVVGVCHIYEPMVDNVAPIDAANETSLSFCKDIDALEKTKAAIVIVSRDVAVDSWVPGKDNKVLIVVENPRLAFIEVMERYFKEEHVSYEIHQSASVPGRGGNFFPEISIGPFSYISPRSVEIGRCTVIGSHVYISDKVVIGKGCNIQSHISIGNDGFGYQKDKDGIWKKFPSIGGVVIGDNVELADHVNIDRGTLGNTIVGDGTKVSKYGHIGHNVVIGKNCFLAGKSQFGGGSKVGDDTFIGMKVTLKQGVKVGSNCYIGMCSMVNKDIEDGWVAYGSPCKPMKRNTKELWKKGGM